MIFEKLLSNIFGDGGGREWMKKKWVLIKKINTLLIRCLPKNSELMFKKLIVVRSNMSLMTQKYLIMPDNI